MQVSLAGLAGTLLGCTRHELPDHIRPPRVAAVPPIAEELRLLVVGDWGSGQYEQWEVAQGCEAVAREVGGFHAGIFLGDNFYPGGVESVDDPLWKEYFEDVYDTEHLRGLTWYAILGNHDHAGDPAAQIAYSDVSGGRWSMPWYFYRKDFAPDGAEPLLSMIGIDTDQNLEFQDEQLQFLRREFADLQGASWPVIVCGHHPFISNGRHEIKASVRSKLEPVIAAARPMAYFCGHDHNLQLIERPGMLHVVSGGGGKMLHNLNGHADGTLYKERSYGFVVLTVRRGSATVEFHDRRGVLKHRHHVDRLEG